MQYQIVLNLSFPLEINCYVVKLCMHKTSTMVLLGTFIQSGMFPMNIDATSLYVRHDIVKRYFIIFLFSLCSIFDTSITVYYQCCFELSILNVFIVFLLFIFSLLVILISQFNDLLLSK